MRARVQRLNFMKVNEHLSSSGHLSVLEFHFIKKLQEQYDLFTFQ